MAKALGITPAEALEMDAEWFLDVLLFESTELVAMKRESDRNPKGAAGSLGKLSGALPSWP